MGDKFTVTAPVSSFNGVLAGLLFRDGQATADSATDARALAYCRRHSYRIEPAYATGGLVASPAEGASDRPKPTAPKADWIAYAISRGADTDTVYEMTKADLVDQYGKDL